MLFEVKILVYRGLVVSLSMKPEEEQYNSISDSKTTLNILYLNDLARSMLFKVLNRIKKQNVSSV